MSPTVQPGPETAATASPATEPKPRSRRKVAGAVVLLSLGLNVTFFFQNPPQKPELDAQLYDRIARLVFGYAPVDKRPEEDVTTGLQGLSVRGFLYPAFLGTVYRLVGSPDHRVVCLLQAVIMVPLVVLLTYMLGVKIFDHRIGALAALLYALYLPAVWHANFLLTETLLAVVVSLSLFVLARFIQTERAATGLLLGFISGVIGISHPLWLFFPVVIVVVLIMRYRKTGSRRLMIRRVGPVALAAAAVLVPWQAVRVASGLPQMGQGGTGFGGGGGWTFYVGSRVETNASTVPEDYVVAESYFPPGRLKEVYEKIRTGDLTVEPILASIIAEKVASPDKQDWVLTDFDYYRAGIENWLHKPLLVPKLLGIKIYWYLFGVATTPSYPLQGTVLYNRTWRAFFMILNWPLIILAAIGLWMVARSRRGYLVIFAPLVVHTVVVIATYSDNRYKYPNMPAVFLLAAVALIALQDRFHARSE